MKQLSIKISGFGTKVDIIESLKTIIGDLITTSDEYLSEGVEWEDPTLITSIDEATEEEIQSWVRDDDESVKATFVSVWDDGIEIRTQCKYNLKTRVLSDLNSVDGDGLDILQDQYIELPDGNEVRAWYSEDNDEWEGDEDELEKIWKELPNGNLYPTDQFTRENEFPQEDFEL